MAATSSSIARRSDSSARVSAAARSNRSCRARWALIRSVASARSRSLVSITRHTRSSRRRTSATSVSRPTSFRRCSWATPSNSSCTSRTRDRMLPAVRILSRICATIRLSKRRAFSRGASQAPLPRCSSD